ncbi:MAG: hypothetical protein HFG26_04550 [Provencibacterium sp.]|jgi:hypothetical protein|nr:hypothetical protein [Provencibacterium sp.]
MSETGGHGSSRRPHHKSRAEKVGNGYSEDLILLASSLASQLARGRTECELETMINLLDILQDTLVGVLAQRRICNRQRLEILQDGDFII